MALVWAVFVRVLAPVLVLQLMAAAAQADPGTLDRGPASAAPASPAAKPPPDPIRDVSLTSGLAIGVSFPTGAGLIGVRADYLFQLPHTWFRLGVHAGAGAWLCPDSASECHASVSFGALGAWGHHHRLVLEARTGTLGGVSLTLHGQVAASRAVWGVGAEIGYEYMADTGFFLRCGVGIAVLVDATIEPLSERLGPSLTLLHVGYKAW